MCLFVCLSVCMSVYLSVCLYVYLSVCLCLKLLVSPFLRPSVCVSVYNVSICRGGLPSHLFACLATHIHVSLWRAAFITRPGTRRHLITDLSHSSKHMNKVGKEGRHPKSTGPSVSLTFVIRVCQSSLYPLRQRVTLRSRESTYQATNGKIRLKVNEQQR